MSWLLHSGGNIIKLTSASFIELTSMASVCLLNNFYRITRAHALPLIVILGYWSLHEYRDTLPVGRIPKFSKVRHPWGRSSVVERVLRMYKAPGSIPGVSIIFSRL